MFTDGQRLDGIRECILPRAWMLTALIARFQREYMMNFCTVSLINRLTGITNVAFWQCRSTSTRAHQNY